MSVSVVMIVKNEATKIQACLDSVRAVADEIIVVDTGSSDHTKALAAQYTDLIVDFVWQDDFAAARNFGLSKATQTWILTIDADEVLDPQSALLLPEILAQQDSQKAKVLNFRVLTPGVQPLYTRACFPNFLEIYFKGCIHEWPCRENQPLPAENCPHLILHHHPSAETLEKTLYYQALLTTELKKELSLHEQALYLYHLGKTEEKRKQPHAAYRAFKQAYTAYLSSDRAQQRLLQTILVPLVRLAIELSTEANTESMISQALEYAQALTTEFPGFVEGWLYLAYSEFWLGDLNKAQRHYQRIFQDLEKQKLPQAVSVRTRMMALIGLARIALLQGQSQAGIAGLIGVYKQNSSPEIAWHLARAYDLNQQETEACLWAERANGSNLIEYATLPIWSPLETKQTQDYRAKNLITGNRGLK